MISIIHYQCPQQIVIDLILLERFLFLLLIYLILWGLMNSDVIP